MVALWLCVAAVVVATVASFALSSMIPLAVVAVPWFDLLRSRIGGAGALALTILLSMWVALVFLVLAQPLALDLFDAARVTVGGLGIAGAWWARDHLIRTVRPGDVRWLGLLAGPLVWAGAAGIVWARSGFIPTWWTNSGDAINNLLFARTMLVDEGLRIGTSQNPTPLPSALIAMIIGPDRDDVPIEWLGIHDIEGLALAMVLLAVLTCITSGLMVGALASLSATNRFVPFAAGSGSALATVWFVTGYPADYGFANALAALVTLFASISLLSIMDRHPVWAVVGALVGTTVTLAAWSLLGAIPALVALLAVVRHRKSLLRVRGRDRAVLILAALQVVLWFGLGVMPVVIRSFNALGAVGAAFPFSHGLIVEAGALAILGALLAWRGRGLLWIVATMVVVGVVVAGLGALLLTGGSDGSPWTYYPMKYAWFGAVLLLFVALGWAFVLADHMKSRVAGALVALAALCVTLGTMELSWNAIAFDPKRPTPYALVMADSEFERTLVERAAERESERLAVEWGWDNMGLQSQTNFLRLMLSLPDLNGHHHVRGPAYRQPESNDDVEWLCELSVAVGGITVGTPDPDMLGPQLDTQCPEAEFSLVKREEPLRG